MMLPPVLLAPEKDLSAGQRLTLSRVTGCALFLILSWMAWARFVQPQWPVDDPDTWGYLHPAIAKLVNGTFEHTYGRNFLYPGWLYVLLRLTGDFRAIPVAQHILGLGAGILVWLIWRQWRSWFTASRLPALVDAALGCGLVAFFGRASSVIHYEAQIRPEAVFPFFAALSLCLLLAFLRTWHVGRQFRRASILAGMTLFITALVYQLKPSFGLAVGVTLLPVLLAPVMTRPQQAGRTCLWLIGAVAVGGMAALVLFVLPERSFARSDAQATTFLPETMLAIHADLIRDQMNQDVHEGILPPFPAPPLAATAAFLNEEFRRACDPALRPYETLGFNPDYLIYRDSFCRWLNVQLPPDQASRFCFYYYRRACVHRPVAMLAKIGRELGIFYSFHCPAFRSSTRLWVAQYYQKTLEFLELPHSSEQMALYPPARVYVDAVRRLTASPAYFRTPHLLALADLVVSVTYLLVMILFAMGLAAVGYLPRAERRKLWVPGAVLALIYAICFGNCLTIAIVHSMTQHRYTLNLLVYAAFCEAAALVWLWEFVLAWRANQPVQRQIGPALPPRNGS